MFLGAFNMVLASRTSIDYASVQSYVYTSEGNQTLNGTPSFLQQQDSGIIFSLSMVTGIVILITAFVIVGVLAGIRVLGSGLSNYSVQLIHKSAVYYGLWAIFSAISFPVFAIIPLFGIFIWFILTLIYSLGFFQTLNAGDDDD
jgi:hypothetical protein